MADYSLDQIKAVPGANSSNTPLNIVSAGRNALCGLYRAKPWALFGVPGPAEDMSPQSQSYRQVLDNLCDDAPLPEMQPKFNGGKCAIPYDVTYRFSGDPDGAPPFVDTSTIRLPGPIRGVVLRTNPADSQLWQYVIPYGTAGQVADIGNFLKAETNVGSFSAGITNIVAVNPALDVCGGSGPTFTPQPVFSPDYNPTAPYTDRGITIIPTVNIPPIIIPPGAVQVSPKFEVKIGPNRVTFDLSGGSLKLEANPSVNINIGSGPNSENTNAPVTNNNDLTLIGDRFDLTDDLIKKLKKCVCDPLPPFDVEQLFAGVQSGCYTLLPKERNKFCAINITQSPVNPKSQNGGSAPDVLYAGWAWFHAGGGQASERFPIDAFGKIFANEGRYGVFCFTLYEGYRADVFGLHVPLEYYNSIHD